MYSKVDAGGRHHSHTVTVYVYITGLQLPKLSDKLPECIIFSCESRLYKMCILANLYCSGI